ncbi:hypothetical protein HK100_011187 [Physocladia obscura]|uniref:SET domain-containing protein n=1 Tax=Physocladia obscura TaxID=109957 RepID=A0AAD5XDF0_9FUNG|nr:hypothetical protein HK100_011187 [Physocladia obscura]
MEPFDVLSSNLSAVPVSVQASPFPLPANWPADIKFIIDYVFSPQLNLVRLPAVSIEHAAKFNLRMLLPKPYASPFALIVRINNSKHPANGQNGLFAITDIPPNTHIVDYVGEIISADSEQVKTSDYVLDFGGGGEGVSLEAADGREIRLAVDGAVVGNEGRMVNDFRGVPAEPDYSKRSFNKKKSATAAEFAHFANKSKANVEFRSYVNAKTREMRMGLFCCEAKGIRKGQELLISYGKGYWASRGLDLSEMYQKQ